MKTPEESSMAKPDPWEIFREGCEALPEVFFEVMVNRDRLSPQLREFALEDDGLNARDRAPRPQD